MTINPSIINKIKEDYESLELLGAINAFYQIKGLVIEEPPKYFCQFSEALLKIHQMLFILTQEHYQEENFKQDKLKKLINIVEENAHRLIDFTDVIILMIDKVNSLIFCQND